MSAINKLNDTYQESCIKNLTISIK